MLLHRGGARPSSHRRVPQLGLNPASNTQMGVHARNSLLQVLPNELVSNILVKLEYRDLASCIRVRGLFFFLVPMIHATPAVRPLALAGVQMHARSDRQFLFTAIPPRIGKIWYEGCPYEHNVNCRT